MKKREMMILLLGILLFGCLIVALCGVGAISIDLVNTSLRDRRIEQIYQSRLGIGNSDHEVVSFLNQELVGLTHTEAIAQLGQWGVVNDENCPTGKTTGGCIIYVSDFLDVRDYEFTIIYEKRRIKIIRIDYS
jgi:hypothetical protein